MKSREKGKGGKEEGEVLKRNSREALKCASVIRRNIDSNLTSGYGDSGAKLRHSLHSSFYIVPYFFVLALLIHLMVSPT